MVTCEPLLCHGDGDFKFAVGLEAEKSHLLESETMGYDSCTSSSAAKVTIVYVFSIS
jgi:hypothetical protein